MTSYLVANYNVTNEAGYNQYLACLLYTSPSPRD